MRTGSHVRATLLSIVLVLAGCGADTPPTEAETSSVDEVLAFFRSQGKQVLTFVGYSGSGYEDEARMLGEARRILGQHDPRKTVVNIGATPDGIGAVYGVAKSMGFTTTGIVSTQARKYEVTVSPDADHVFFVEDETWGGLLEGSRRLAPTSEAMVTVSDELVGIGGGEVARDELLAARTRGKSVTFIPADMNHARAIEKAKKKGRPVPKTFHGAAHEAFAER